MALRSIGIVTGVDLARIRDYEVVWCGSMRHVTLSGDYPRRPDPVLAAMAESRKLGRGTVRVAGAGQPCACGCGRLTLTPRARWVAGHQPHGRVRVGVALTIKTRRR